MSMSFQRQIALGAVILAFANAVRDDAALDTELKNEETLTGVTGIWLAKKPTAVPEQFMHGPLFYSAPRNSAKLAGGWLPWGRSIEAEETQDPGWVMFRATPVRYLPTSMLQKLRGQQWKCVEGEKKGQTLTVVSKEVAEDGKAILKTIGGEKVSTMLHILSKPVIACIRIDVLPHTDLSEKKRIAVVGCGIAGIVTSLELALREEVEQIVVMDREAGCAKGTSGRIAAEMMFYNFERDLFNKGDHSWVFTSIKVKHQQGSANFLQGTLGSIVRLWWERWWNAQGHTNRVTCNNRCTDIQFGSSPSGLPVVKSTTRTDDVKEGDVLASITGVFPDELWDTWGPDYQVDKLLKSKIKKDAKIELVRGADLRVLEAYQAQFFAAAAERLKSLIASYPELCEAVITPFCCQDKAARQRIAIQDWGYNCLGYAGKFTGNDVGNDAGMGMAEVFMTPFTAKHTQDKGGTDNPTDFEVWDSNQTKWMLPTYLGRDARFGPGQDPVFGSAVSRKRSGFVRTENLGAVFEKIMTTMGHLIWPNTELKKMVVTEDFYVITDTIGVRHVWQQVGQFKTFVDLEHTDPVKKDGFHGLILCTGAAPELVNSLDMKMHKQLLPGLGNIVVGPKHVVPESERRIGVVLEEMHMYLRSTKDGSLAVGGGLWMVPLSRAEKAVRSLPYKQGAHTIGEIWGGTGDEYMKQSKVGRWLVNQSETIKQGGARPLSHFGNFPLIKLHPYAPVVANTGGGVNGFSISWKSGQIAADLVLKRRVDKDQTGEPWEERAWSWMTPTPSSKYRLDIPIRILVAGMQLYDSSELREPLLPKKSKSGIIVPKYGILSGYEAENGQYLVIAELFGAHATSYLKAKDSQQRRIWEWAVWRFKTEVTISGKTWKVGDMFFGTKASESSMTIWEDPNMVQQVGQVNLDDVEPCNDSTACDAFAIW